MNGDPVVTRFTPAGKTAFVEWVTGHYAELERVDQSLRGPWAKLEAYAARLTLLIQEIRFVLNDANDENVDAASVEAAVALVAYFKDTARAVYGRLHADPLDQRVVRVIEWAHRNEKATLTARELRRAKVAGIKTPGEAEAILRELAERGHGRLDQPGRGSTVLTFERRGATCQESREHACVPTVHATAGGARSMPVEPTSRNLAPDPARPGTIADQAEPPDGSGNSRDLATGTTTADDRDAARRIPVPGESGYLEWLGPAGARPLTSRERRLRRLTHLRLVRASSGLAELETRTSKNAEGEGPS